MPEEIQQQEEQKDLSVDKTDETDAKQQDDSSKSEKADEASLDTEIDRLNTEAAAAEASVEGDETAPTEGDDKDAESEETADDGEEKEPAVEGEDGQEEQKPDEEKDPSLTDPTKAPPFHEHPAWKRVVAERDALKPVADRQIALEQYCATNGISAAEVTNMFEIAALMQHEPQKAYERLMPIVSGLAQFLGHEVPTDLQEQVTMGKLTPEQAKEMSKLRANAKLQEHQRRQLEETQRAQMQQYIGSAVNTWTAAKQKTDLAFKPKVNGAPDGLWELVDDRYARLFAANPPRTPQDAVALAEQAYQSVKAVFAPAKKVVVPPTKRLSSDRSSSLKNKKEPTTLDEVAMAATGYKWETRRH